MVSVLLEYIDLFNIFLPNTSYYAGIMLDAFRYLLCSKLYRHNWRKPNKGLMPPIPLMFPLILPYDIMTQTMLLG